MAKRYKALVPLSWTSDKNGQQRQVFPGDVFDDLPKVCDVQSQIDLNYMVVTDEPLSELKYIGMSVTESRDSKSEKHPEKKLDK